MATIQDAIQLANDLKAVAQNTLDTLNTLDLKLDEIRNFIAGLSGVPQSDIDTLNALLSEAKAIATSGSEKAAADLAEADSLDEPAPVA